jgi:hypothetical protein
MRIVLVAFLTLFSLGRPFIAAVEVEWWHSYVHSRTVEKHYSFTLARYRRGLFWGPCAFSTKALVWQYDFDLAGDQVVYTTPAIEVKPGLAGDPLKIERAVVTVDRKHAVATIKIKLHTASGLKDFAGNGTFHINALPQ